MSSWLKMLSIELERDELRVGWGLFCVLFCRRVWFVDVGVRLVYGGCD